MPPSVARLEVEVSGPKPSPCGLTAAFSASCTTPGPTRAVRRSTSISWIWSMWREVSSTMPCAGGLAGEARAGAAGDDRDPGARRRPDRGGDVGGVARERHEQRRAGVHARVAGVEMARVGVGARRRAAPLRCLESPYRSDPYPGRRMSHRSGRHFLQIPGPTNVPDRVLRAIDAPTIDHRGPDFARLGLEVLDGLRHVFQTSGPVVVYPSSGTGAWEAALVNTLSPGDRVLAFETGHFATLWRAMAERLGLVGQVGRGRLAARRRPRRRARRARGDRTSPRSWSSTTRPRPA